MFSSSPRPQWGHIGCSSKVALPRDSDFYSKSQKILNMRPKIMSTVVMSGSPQQQQKHIAQQDPQPDFFGGGVSAVHGASP